MEYMIDTVPVITRKPCSVSRRHLFVEEKETEEELEEESVDNVLLHGLYNHCVGLCVDNR